MTLGDALDQLVVGTGSLADVLAAVRVTVCEDAPEETSTLAVDELADALVELAGEAELLRNRVRSLVGGPGKPSQSDVQRVVVFAQGKLNRIADELSERVVAGERWRELERTTHRGGASWRAWWSATARGLAECEPAVRAVRDELFDCWRELTDNPGAATPAVCGALEDKS